MFKSDSELLTTDEAARFLHVQRNTLEIWRSTHRVRIPFVKLGGAVRYRRQDLEKFVRDNLQED